MAARKLLTPKRVMTVLAWIAFVSSCIVLVLLDPQSTKNVFVLIIELGVMLLTVPIAAVLVIIYRDFFSQWRGLGLLIAIFTLGRLAITQFALPGGINFLLTMLILDIMVVLGVSVGLVLWRHDAGLPLIGWLLVIFIWTCLVANRVQGNILDAYLKSIGNGANSPLWWFDSLMCLAWWALPLGIISFLWHTVRLVYHEIRGV